MAKQNTILSQQTENIKKKGEEAVREKKGNKGERWKRRLDYSFPPPQR